MIRLTMENCSVVYIVEKIYNKEMAKVYALHFIQYIGMYTVGFYIILECRYCVLSFIKVGMWFYTIKYVIKV